MISTYAKGCQDQIGRHFKAYEFDCACSHCTETLVSTDLVHMLDALRDELGAKLVITSGYRCQWHQDQLKAQGFETAPGISQHTLGNAADVRSDSRSGADLEIFAAQAGFRAIGVGKEWIHADTRPELRRWKYSS